MGHFFEYEHADPWATDFVDVESINQQASDALVQRIEAVRKAAPAGPAHLRSSATLILGPPGSGKTHLFARLRKKCGRRAAFVLVRPEIGVLPTPRQILAHVVDALERHAIDGGEDRQIDVVVGALLSALDGSDRWPNVAIADMRGASDRQARLDTVLDRLTSWYDDLAPSFVERLLQVPFVPRNERRALLQYLSGRELDERQLKLLGLSRGMADEDVMPAIRTLGVVAAFGAPVLLLFDQLENLVSEDAEAIHAHARLFCELFDPPVRGFVLVQMALDAEWNERIRPRLSEAERSRLESTKLPLHLPSPEQREALMRAWYERFDPELDVGPFPWPFLAKSWQSWVSRPGVTPRMLMIEVREQVHERVHGENVEGVRTVGDVPHGAPPPDAGAATDQRLAMQWQEHLTHSRAALAEAEKEQAMLDAWRIVSGARAYLELRGAVVTSSPRTPDQIHVKSGDTSRTLVVLQHANGVALASALKKCATLASKQRTRALREARFELKPSWKASVSARDGFLAHPGASWHGLDGDTCAHFLAIPLFLASARSKDLTDSAGAPLPQETAEAWLRRTMAEGRADEILGTLLGEQPLQTNTTTPAAAIGLPLAPLPESTAQIPVAAGGPPSVILSALRRLHLTSFERLVREVRATDSTITHGQVLAALQNSTEVTWLGRSIVCAAEVAS